MKCSWCEEPLNPWTGGDTFFTLLTEVSKSFPNGTKTLMLCSVPCIVHWASQQPGGLDTIDEISEVLSAD